MNDQAKPDGWLHLPTGNVFNHAGLQQHLPGWIAKWGEGVRSDFIALWRGHDALPVATVIDASRMPAPDLLVQSHGGQVMPSMFWFAIEGQSLHDIASEHGFDISFHDIIAGAESEEAGAALEAQYTVNPDGMLAEFAPDVPLGWQYGGKWHGEDGPVACFLRKREAK